MGSTAGNKVTLFHIVSGKFQAHVDDCRQCAIAKFTGMFCAHGKAINEEIRKLVCGATEAAHGKEHESIRASA